MSSGQLRIATWNIAGGHTVRSAESLDYDPQEHVEYFASQLRNLAPDVVCLQESKTNRHDTLAARLGRAAGFAHVFDTPSCPSHIDPNYQLSNAILSRQPFESQQAIVLPLETFSLSYKGEPAEPYQRMAQIVTLGGLAVVNLHLEPLGRFHHNYERGEGLAYAHQLDRALLKVLRRPLVIAADWNTDRLEKAHAPLLAAHRLREADLGLATTPAASHPDHIVYSPELTCIAAGTVKTQTDHYLCWADFGATG